jgi:D-alanyl-D-alanine carboxypeptidase/D-alanyl-D-alanine-endopeptidase (penicillin-binding protein 4)
MKPATFAALPIMALALCFGATAAGRSAASRGPAGRIDEILNRPGLQRVQFSACVVRREDGAVVYERNPHLALLPASNMKIVTTAAALEILGADFAFVTRVGLSGEDLVVVGSGDPLFGDPASVVRGGRRSESIPREVAERLKEAGIESVADIVLDASIFDDQRTHPGWPANQLNQKYACEVSGLNYRGNCAEVSLLNRDGRVELVLDPPTDCVTLVNDVRPRAFGRTRISLDRTGVPGELVVTGFCRGRAGPYAFAVENPPLFFGGLLRDALVEAGIRVTGEILIRPVQAECEFRPVIEYRTPLGDCLTMANKESLGLAAESLFKRLGAESVPDGKGGSWERGCRVLSDYLRGLGIGEEEFYLADGSGLCRDDRLSAWALTRILLHLAGRPDWDFFEGTLAVGGMDGTIENHFWERPYRGRVRAKSGYLRGVRALSGIVRTDGGDYIFSFLANRGGNGTRLAIDAAVKAILDGVKS